jgi:hypothetical protein
MHFNRSSIDELPGAVAPHSLVHTLFDGPFLGGFSFTKTRTAWMSHDKIQKATNESAHRAVTE